MSAIDDRDTLLAAVYGCDVCDVLSVTSRTDVIYVTYVTSYKFENLNFKYMIADITWILNALKSCIHASTRAMLVLMFEQSAMLVLMFEQNGNFVVWL